MQDKPLPKDQFDNLLEAFGGYGARAGYLLWRGAPKYGSDRLDKVPCRSDNGAVPNVGNSPEAMAQLTLDEAVSCARKLDFNGTTAGISMYCPKAQLYGVDFDNCVVDGRDGARLAPWVEEIVGSSSTYVELSPSGTGIRVILSDVPASIKPFMTGAERHSVGLYGIGTKKHLTLTGRRLEGHSGAHIDRDDAMMSRLLAKLAQHAAEKGRDVGSIMGRYPPGDQGMAEALDDIRTGTSLHDATVAYIAKAWAAVPEERILETLVEAYGVSERKKDAPGTWADRVDDIPGIVEWVRKANGGRPAGTSAPVSAEEAARMKKVVERSRDAASGRYRGAPALSSQTEPDWAYLLPGQPHDPRPEPLDESELEVVREAWGRLDEMTAAEHDEAWDVICAVRLQAQGTEESLTLERDWGDWLETIGDPEWIIDGWVPRGLLTTLFGGDGAGKSFIMLSIGLRLAVGRPVLATPAKPPMKVLFLSAEDSDRSFAKRMRDLIAHFRFTPEEMALLNQNFFAEPNLLTEDVKLMEFQREGTHKLTEFGERVRQAASNVDFAILDPISDIYEDEENVRQKVVAFMRQLIMMTASNNIGMVLLGHPAKAEESEYSGSGAWSSKSRSRLLLEKSKDGKVVTLSQKKTSYGQIMAPVTWTWGDRSHPVEFAGDESRATVLGHRDHDIERVITDGLAFLGSQKQQVSAARNQPNFIGKLLAAAGGGMDGGYDAMDIHRVMREMVRKGLLDPEAKYDGTNGKPMLHYSKGHFKKGLWFADDNPLV